MLSFRVAVLASLIVLTASIASSIAHPLFQKTSKKWYGDVQISAYYFRHIDDEVVSVYDMRVIQRWYMRDCGCHGVRVFYHSASSLTVAAAIFAAMAALISAAWIAVGRSVTLTTLIFALTLLSFSSSGTAFGLMAYAYTHDFCADTPDVSVMAPRAAGYDMMEGFSLLCGSVGGLAVLVAAQAIVLYCGWQTKRRSSSRAARWKAVETAEMETDSDESTDAGFTSHLRVFSESSSDSEADECCDMEEY